VNESKYAKAYLMYFTSYARKCTPVYVCVGHECMRVCMLILHELVERKHRTDEGEM
jgi:hypothetical protein